MELEVTKGCPCHVALANAWSGPQLARQNRHSSGLSLSRKGGGVHDNSPNELPRRGGRLWRAPLSAGACGKARVES